MFIKAINSLKLSIILFLGTFFILGSAEEDVQRGQVIDSPVANLTYICGDKEAKTDLEGMFECSIFPVKFMVGKIEIATIDQMPKDSKVFIQDLVGVPRSVFDNEQVIKISRFLQSLDDDGNIEDNIYIDENVVGFFTNSIKLIDLTEEEIEELLRSINKSIVSEEEAISHLRHSIQEQPSPENDSNETPNTPTITDLPQITYFNSSDIEINGEVGTTVWVNGTEQGTIGSNGTLTLSLDTSGSDGTKAFTIFLKNSQNNQSQTLSFSIERDTITRTDALKFLRQAAFRSDETEIAYVMENGYESWIDNQFTMVGDLDSDTDTKYGYLESSLRMLHKIDPAQYPTSIFTNPTLLDESVIDGKRISTFRGSIFWQKALHDENQLRQRVAYALSQILVVSDVSPAGQATKFRGESISQYYDILYKHSFGNYRELLTDVTHSSAMGYFMTYVGSKAAAPDENYARELTQLFTIGLYELNNDGTLQGGGNPIPSYNQLHVTNLSKVFTGWDLDDKQINSKGVHSRYGSTAKTDNSWVSPLQFTASHHDTTNKTILNNKTISGGTNGSLEIEQALDYLFANHNVAPFISRHLIMRFITSNPTPAYIGRISTVFNNNGSGVKGDLKAVIKAILLDDEARGITVVANFGKVDEMLVAFPHFLSAFGAQPIPSMSFSNGARLENVYWLSPDKVFEQGLLAADSVFNFYSNEFVPSDPYFASNHLVSPELQIQNTPNLIDYSNLIKNLMQRKEKYSKVNHGSANSIEEWATNRNYGQYTLTQGLLYLDLTPEYEVLEKALDNETVANGDFTNMGNGSGANENRTRAINALIEHLDNKLLGGTMPQAYKTEILTHLESLEYPLSITGRYNRAKAIVPFTIRAIVTSPLFMVLK